MNSTATGRSRSSSPVATASSSTRSRFPEVAGDRGRAVVPAQQRPAVRDRDRVVIDIHDPCQRVRRLGDLMHISHRGNPRAQVQELVDAPRDKMQHRPAQEGPIVPEDLPKPGKCANACSPNARSDSKLCDPPR